MTTLPLTYLTNGGIRVTRTARTSAYESGTAAWMAGLDSRRGAVFSSNYEYPGRYSRWDTAIVDPPLGVTARGDAVWIEAFNSRGNVLMPALARALRGIDGVVDLVAGPDRIDLTVERPQRRFPEEKRSRQPSVFSCVRAIIDLFGYEDDEVLGLYGAFGYDLAYQFEPIELQQARPDDQRDLVLFLPDEVLMVDHYSRRATVYAYEFAVDGTSTEGLSRETEALPFVAAENAPERGDHAPGEYAEVVKRAFPYFERGDLFEVVPGQMFTERCPAAPSAISRRLKSINPSPYSFFINLGAREYLVGASPEMYVRVTGGRRVETCPISGTIRRGRNAIEDEAQIRALLNSEKDMAELTMCSDVDRNDKSRICVPGSVRVIGRRQIELYSRLIHTVDHIEGVLADGMDALDAFLTHTWAVTVTGAPKRWAMKFIEENEKSPRAWYGGAVGMVHFNGDMNTGLTLRTIRIKDGIAEIRAGATLLYDSDPEDEERETELKAAAMLSAVRDAGTNQGPNDVDTSEKPGKGIKILILDHEDSFVHTLGNYFRQTGADVVTLRVPVSAADLAVVEPDLVVLSPGPGSPSDFNCAETIRRLRDRDLPIFGVCLGLQALAEAFGGKLAQLDVPVHGKPSVLGFDKECFLFGGVADPLSVGRYHSLIADRDALPDCFSVTAETEDGVVMAISHDSEPIAAVQFHPESILSLDGDAGLKLVANVVAKMPKRPKSLLREAAYPAA
ncbi:MAG: anthranilate synthase component I [Pseudomonadota bacterium]